MIITAEMLRKAGVHEDEVTQLTSLYGERVDLTEAWALEHAHDHIDWRRAAEGLLPDSAWRTYHEARKSARREFDEAEEAAQRTYNDATEPARRAYDDAMAAAQRAYNKATGAARRTYNDATAAARRVYREARAVAFARALNA